MILRSCTMKDLPLLERWDPRGEMWTGDKKSYLEMRTKSPSYRMYIGEHKCTPDRSTPVAWGQIRIERRAFILSWFVAPKFRNRGFGFELAWILAHMCRNDSPRQIRARINTNRPYSERLAIRIGMVTNGKLLDTGEKWWVK